MKPVEAFVTNACIDLITLFEGLRLKAYKCAAGIWTIGYGNTLYPDGRKVQPGDKITKEHAREIFNALLNNFAQGLYSKTIAGGIELNPNQFGALLSLSYNIGLGALFASKSIYGKLCNGEIDEAGHGILLYNKARVKGVLKVLRGLTRRRTREHEMYYTPWIEPATLDPVSMAEVEAITLRPVQKLKKKTQTFVDGKFYKMNTVEAILKKDFHVPLEEELTK